MLDKDAGAVGIMQPYYFPYWAHFSLIAQTNIWIVFDECQYQPKSWMNRNRILHPASGWQYITVPLANSSRNTRVSEARILDTEATQKSHIAKLSHYKKSASYFSEVKEIILRAYSFVDDNHTLASLSIGSLISVCEYLEIDFNPIRSSSLGLTYPAGLGPGDWAPFICSQIGASAYINPISGSHLFKNSCFADRGIKLLFLKPSMFSYRQGSYSPCQNLSVLDALMWLSPKDIKSGLLGNVEIVSH